MEKGKLIKTDDGYAILIPPELVKDMPADTFDVSRGDDGEIVFRPIPNEIDTDVTTATDIFITQYDKALKGLSKR